MRKRFTSWGYPAAAFAVAAMFAVFAGPTMGAFGRLRALQGSTDHCGCQDGNQGPGGGVRTGQSRASFSSSAAPVQYSNGQNLLFISELEADGPRGWSHRRNMAGWNLGDGLVGPGWKVSGLLQLVGSGSLINVINGTTSIRSFQDNGNGTYTAGNWYKDKLVADTGNALLILTDPEGPGGRSTT